MDQFFTLLTENAAAAFTILGTITGGIVGFVGNYFLQKQKNRADIDHWRRSKAADAVSAAIAEAGSIVGNSLSIQKMVQYAVDRPGSQEAKDFDAKAGQRVEAINALEDSFERNLILIQILTDENSKTHSSTFEMMKAVQELKSLHGWINLEGLDKIGPQLQAASMRLNGAQKDLLKSVSSELGTAKK
ncbi:hypothetical protein [Kocuria rosea]|uniref:hypothetical protein n=1 Tax=Kocuria rosea TaxID=1275 RepID=UPI001110B3F9|nr:hypothetical protein [Kocuria rosea]QCY32635.1 hypothetical protein EQG70_06850 [Kocuria rosea]TQN34688.1 hypothetical protein FHX38_2792 [Kocuria rosea]